MQPDDLAVLRNLLESSVTNETQRQDAMVRLARLEKVLKKLQFVQEREHQEKAVLSRLLDRTSVDLQKALDEAQAASRAKSGFLANMSHELRTPLNAIIGYTEMILSNIYGDLNEKQADRLNRVRTNGQHLLGLINDILDLSKIEAGKMEVVPEAFEVERVVQQAVDSARPIGFKNGNNIGVEIASGATYMHSDPQKLRQILANLLSNACKFTQNGNVQLVVARFTQDEQDWFQFDVVDTGIGMSEEQTNHIFDEFVQIDSSYSRLFEGTGLGLAITKRLCNMLGGAISVTSTVGTGTTFTVKLPAQYANP